jgi:hypothetical protein
MHGTYNTVEDRHNEVDRQIHNNSESDCRLCHFYQARWQNDYCFANVPNKNRVAHST